jgi:hypothetical protein
MAPVPRPVLGSKLLISFFTRFMQLVLAVGIRAVGWISTALKDYLRGDTQTAIIFLYTGVPSGLLPVVGLLLSYNNYISTSRPVWVTAANILQFLQVGKYYDHLYPCTGAACNELKVPLAKAFTALASSNGVMFLIMTAFMGSLTFKWLFITQCINCLILIASNRSICVKGPALRRAYMWIHSQLVNPFFLKVAQHMWPTSSSSPSKVLDAAAAALHTSSAASHVAESSVLRCIGSQVALQLVFGLWIPCWVAYARELQARKSFLRSRCGQNASAGALFPSSWEMFMYALPAVAFPWCLFIASGTHLEY